MCEYCDKRVNNKKIRDVDDDIEDSAEIIFLDRRILHIELDATDKDGYKAEDFFEINYCPMCGRKLGG